MVGKVDKDIECPKDIKSREPEPVPGPGKKNENKKGKDDVFKKGLKELVEK
jgi:hypothetical protein